MNESLLLHANYQQDKNLKYIANSEMFSNQRNSDLAVAVAEFGSRPNQTSLETSRGKV